MKYLYSSSNFTLVKFMVLILANEVTSLSLKSKELDKNGTQN